MNKFKFYVDFLTPGDAELDAIAMVEGTDIDYAIQQLRDEYEARGEFVFRIRLVNGLRTETVFLAKGQDS